MSQIQNRFFGNLFLSPTPLHVDLFLLEKLSFYGKLGYWFWCPSRNSGGWSEGIFPLFELDPLKDYSPFSVISLFPAYAQTQISEAFGTSFRENRPVILDYSLVLPSKKNRQVQLSVYPVFVENQPPCFEGVIQDIESAVLRGKDIFRRERLSDVLLHSQPDLHMIVDPDGTIAEFRKNKSLPFLTERTKMVGFNIRALFSGTLRDLLVTNLKMAMDQPESELSFHFHPDSSDQGSVYECRILFLPTMKKCLVTIREALAIRILQQEHNGDSHLIRSLIEIAPFPIFITSIENEDVLYVNERAKKDFGLENEPVVGKSVKDFYLRPADREAFLSQLFPSGTIQDFDVALVNTDGSPHRVLMSATVIEYEEKESLLLSLNDITDRKKIQEEVRISEEKYRFITENTLDVIWVYRPDSDRFTYVSPSVGTLRGISAENAIQETLKDSLTRESHQLMLEEFAKAQTQLLKDPSRPVSFLMEVQQPTSDGKKIWVELSATYRKGADGHPEVIGVSRNIQERKKTENEVLYLSTHDQLTGLFNRRFYEEELKRADIERNLPITLIMADVNGLKLTNDAFGHSAGDKILKTFSDILMKETDPNAVVARIGGDEFVIILKKTGSREAEALVSRIMNAISQKQMVRAILSVSFGWKTKTSVLESIEDIYKQSEDDMYRNKLYSGTSFKNDILNLITKSLFEQNSLEHNHADSVSEFCRKIGIALGLDDADVKELTLAGLLHDIGKIAIPESILMKNGALSEAEMVDVRRHPEIGYQILRSVSEFANIAQFVLDHHERMDGSGYPRGLKGEEIPLQSRIIAIAEVYDCLIRRLPYRKAWSKESAVEELLSHSETHFDSRVLSVFIEKVLSQS